MNIDTDKLVEILKNDDPLSVMVVEDNGKDKLVCLFALPELAKEVEAFGKTVLDGKPTYEELVDALIDIFDGCDGNDFVCYRAKYEQLLERIK